MKIEIDGKPVVVEKGATIIEVADNIGVPIPRFCYHKKLSIAANCRMCLVEVDKAPKPLPACATTVTEGMRIWTKSKKAMEAQKGVMEFLLINHPLDCPICDQGGECELQDLSVGYGQGVSNFSEHKRTVTDNNFGPLISSEMTRCIHCTRCVRFGTEIAGQTELGLIGRGEHIEISTYTKEAIQSDLSGNIIDLCPVGALTSKPFRFQARAWELQQCPSIAPHDSWGSSIYIHTRRDTVMRVAPKENDITNENWLSDRDRFSYQGLSHNERLLMPKIKRNNQWEIVEWEEALNFLTARIQIIVAKNDNDTLGGIISPSSTTEELYLFQKLIRALGSNHIDHRLKHSDFKHESALPMFPSLGTSIKNLEHQEIIVLIGCDIAKEQPLAIPRIRKAIQNGAEVFLINPIDFDCSFDVSEKMIVSNGNLGNGLLELIKALCDERNEQTFEFLPEVLEEKLDLIICSEKIIKLAKLLLTTKDNLLVLGALAIEHPESSKLFALSSIISELGGIKMGSLFQGANAAGACISGAIPHRGALKTKITSPGLNSKTMFEKPLKAYFLQGVEPDKDLANSEQAQKSLAAAEFVCAITAYETKSLLEHSDVLLPLALFAETQGTYVNIEGRFQHFNASVSPIGEARPGWKILRVLGNFLSLPDFEYLTTESIIKELKTKNEIDFSPECWQFSDELFKNCLANTVLSDLKTKQEQILCIATTHIHDLDPLVRRAQALREKSQPMASLRMSSKNIGAAEIQLEGFESILSVIEDRRVPEGVAWVDRNGHPALTKPYAFYLVKQHEVGT